MNLSSFLAIWALSTSFLFAVEPSYNVGTKSGYGAVYSTTLNGEPVQILDMLISVQKDLTPQEKLDLEATLRIWANGLYEQSNGGVFIGNLRIFDNAVNWDQANVQIATCNAGAWANTGGFLSGGIIRMSLYGACIGNGSSIVNGAPDPLIQENNLEYNLSNPERKIDFAGVLNHENLSHF